MLRRPLLLMCLLWLTPIAAGAQATADPGAPVEAAASAAPQYQVEVIVFAHQDFEPAGEEFRYRRPADDGLSGSDASSAQSLAERPQPELLTLDAPSPAAAAVPGSPAQAMETTEPRPFRFRLLAPEELQLGAVYATLDRLGAYAPLLHAGWVQEGLAEEQARPFDLGFLGALNPAGTIQLHVSRFLHLTVDLSFLGATPPRDAATLPEGLGAGLTELALAPRYELHAARRARSGELHYFDHPAFGVLIVIRPQPAPTQPAGGLPPAA